MKSFMTPFTIAKTKLRLFCNDLEKLFFRQNSNSRQWDIYSGEHETTARYRRTLHRSILLDGSPQVLKIRLAEGPNQKWLHLSWRGPHPMSAKGNGKRNNLTLRTDRYVMWENIKKIMRPSILVTTSYNKFLVICYTLSLRWLTFGWVPGSRNVAKAKFTTTNKVRIPS